MGDGTLRTWFVVASERLRCLVVKLEYATPVLAGLKELGMLKEMESGAKEFDVQGEDTPSEIPIIQENLPTSTIRFRREASSHNQTTPLQSPAKSDQPVSSHSHKKFVFFSETNKISFSGTNVLHYDLCKFLNAAHWFPTYCR